MRLARGLCSCWLRRSTEAHQRVTGLLRARRERPRNRRAAEKRDELASFQLIELHSIPAGQGRMQDIELPGISQRASR